MNDEIQTDQAVAPLHGGVAASLIDLLSPLARCRTIRRFIVGARFCFAELDDGAAGLAKPHGSYLMFPRILLDEGRDSTAFCKRLLLEGKVSTTPGVAFGPTGESHLRLSFCVSEAEIHKAFDRIEAFLL